MIRVAVTLAAGMILGGLDLGTSSASDSPAMPQAGIVAGDGIATTVGH